MAAFEEELGLFEATQPNSADLDDIARGRRLLKQLSADDTLRKVSLLARLGSFYLENKKLDPWESVGYAGDCYAKVVSLAQEHDNAKWASLGLSGFANVLARQYELGRNPEDLAKAEGAFRELIEICERFGMLEEATSSRMNYARLLSKAVHGDRYSNLDRAIALLRQVVNSSSQEARGPSFNPLQYGRALYNLAVPLLQQAEEPHMRTLNINEAVDLLRQALLFRTPDRDPVGRIAVLRALAASYPEWEGADSLAHAHELTEAAKAEAEALSQGGVIPDRAEWAQAAQQRSALFWDLDSLTENREELRNAIANHVVTIDRIPGNLPLLWAEWVGGYAVLVGRIGIEDGKPELWQASRAAFADALRVIPRERDPRLCLILNRELGRVCHQCADWEGSLAANREAASIGLSLADAAGTNVSRANELERVTRAIHFAAYAAARLDRPVEAAELAEIGRARWLDEAIQLGMIRGSSLPEETRIAADEAQASVLELERRELHLLDQGAAGAIRRLENYLGIPFGGTVKVRATADPDDTEAGLREELAFVRAKLQDAHEHLTSLLNAISVEHALRTRLTCSQIQEIALKAGFPIVYLLSSVWGSTAIIVREKAEILPLPGLLRSTVQDLLYGNNGYVKLCAGAEEGDLEESLRKIQATLDAHVIGPLVAWCRENGTTTIALVGLGDVGLLPIQVSTVPTGLDLRLLPSTRALLLSLVVRHSEGAEVKTLLTVGDPGSYGLRPLPFSGMESSVFSALFRSIGAGVTDLSKTPTLARVEQHLSSANHLHLACHGTFRPFSPLNSVVHLEGHEELQVASLLRPALKLTGAELVVLSACNSASGEPWRTPDEAIGFPAAFLAAGARSVVAAQWEVSDAVTLLLMHRFCTALLAGGTDVAGPLADAQRWLRSADSANLVDTINRILDVLGDGEPRRRRLLKEFQDEVRECEAPLPLADLRSWGGFVCVGA